jgi:uncharacterized protein (DUF983 family)
MATGSNSTAMLRGFRCRCPNCGAGALYRRYLKPVTRCRACGEGYGDIRADDFPPYLTILVVGHLVVPLILLSERLGVSTGWQVAFWVPVTLLLTLLLLPRLKGAVIGLMWSLNMGAASPQA